MARLHPHISILAGRAELIADRRREGEELIKVAVDHVVGMRLARAVHGRCAPDRPHEVFRGGDIVAASDLAAAVKVIRKHDVDLLDLGLRGWGWRWHAADQH